MKKNLFVALSLLLSHTFVILSTARADEGMWMLNNLSEKTDSILRSLGLELTHEQLYDTDNPSLNDAIVMFGGFCSGVVVSDNGLVFTNHHCGYNSIQAHSTTRHDYLENGFFAKTYKDELPNPELYVAFHLRTVDVTDQVLAGVTTDTDPATRTHIIDSISATLTHAVLDTINCIYGHITPYYKGQKYYMSVYQRFDDVRLVFAPPQCLGKFGGDTDNWMWPRQTCDFSVFRIYSDANNRPAPYNKHNKPLRPKNYAHISLQGYQPGTYCMTLGYPGSTERYLSSYGIENTMKNINAVRHQVRGVKQDAMKAHMNASEAIRIMYSAKYAQSSNYWKNALGQNQALTNLGVVEEKRTLEKVVPSHILDTLRTLYQANDTTTYLNTMIEESFCQGSDILTFALMSMIQRLNDNESERSERSEIRDNIEKAFKDIDIDTDRDIFAALLKNFRDNVDEAFWPPFVKQVDTLTSGDVEAFTRYLYDHSKLTNKKRHSKIRNSFDLYDDLMFEVAYDVLTSYFYTLPASRDIDQWESKLQQSIMQAHADKEYYPDANFTLRLSFGTIRPLDLATLHQTNETYYTLPASIIAKANLSSQNDDYELITPVRRWLERGAFGTRYTDTTTQDLPLCFLSDNDITGGNSGSGMFDGKGRLIGLAFDGNWEAMSGDYKFDTRLQRCIGVDIRYVLSVIDTYGKGERLINELTIE